MSLGLTHLVKSVQIQRFFLVRIFPSSFLIRENTDQKNFAFGHFIHSDGTPAISGGLSKYKNLFSSPGTKK